MKKLFILLLCLSCFDAHLIYGIETDPPVPKAPPPTTTRKSPQEDLIDLTDESIKAQLFQMENRIKKLEQENRFQDEKIKQLDRSVDDLRRRHIR